MIQCKKERFEITLYKYSVPLYVCVHMDSAMTKYWPFSDFSDHQTNFIIIWQKKPQNKCKLQFLKDDLIYQEPKNIQNLLPVKQ